MSVVTHYRPFTSYDLDDWAGYFNVSILTPTHLQTVHGPYVTDVYGSGLTYKVVGNFYGGMTGGTIQKFTYSKDGVPYFDVSGLNANAARYQKYEDTQNILGIRATLLAGDDVIYGSSGNDWLYGSTGNDTFFGGAGVDTVTYDYGKKNYVISGDSSFAKVTTSGKVDTLYSIERINFGDGSLLALDVKAGENAGAAYRAYQAAFDRKPDMTGLKYWIKQMDAGASLAQVAQGFVNSPEFKKLNPTNDQNTLINNYYLHVLHRPADAAGFQFWKGSMANGMKSNEVLMSFSESQENINNTAGDLGHGLWLL